jgi:hypothetical protein
MSFVSNGGKFKLYTVLDGLIFPTPTQPRISFEHAILSIHFDCANNEKNSRRCLAVCCICFPLNFCDVKMSKLSKLDNGDKAMISMYLSL